ncbi:hypothetical protein JCM5353_008921 [Sporobolomyces roseus]
MHQQARIADLISSLDSGDSKQDQLIQDLVALAREHGLNAENSERLYDVLLGKESLPVSTALSLSNALIPLEPITSCSVLLLVSSLGEAAHTRSKSAGRVKYRLQRRLLQQLAVLCEIGAIDTREGVETLKRFYDIIEKGLDYKMLREPTAALLCHIVETSHLSTARIERIDQLISLTKDVPESLVELSRRYHGFHSPSGISNERFEQRNVSVVQNSDEEFRVWSERVRRIVKSRVAQEGRPASLVWRTLLDRGHGQDPEYFEPLRSFISDYFSFLDHNYRQATAGDDPTQAILTYLLSLCEELPQSCEAFLAEHLRRWDGFSHQESTFALVPYLKAPQLEVLKSQFIGPLLDLSKTMEVGWISSCIESLSTMMIKWAIRDDWDIEVDSSTAYGHKGETLVAVAGLQAIVDSVDSIIEFAVHRFPNSIEMRSSAFDFYDKSLDLSLVHDLPVVVVPSPTFAYSALCGDEFMSVSRMGGILARLREALTGNKTAIQIADPAYTDPVNAFNSRLLEYGNALWKKHFLAPTPPGEESTSHGLGTEILDQIRLYADGRNQSAQGALGLTTHAAFSSLAVKFLKILAEKQGKNIDGFEGKVTTSSLKQLNSVGQTFVTLGWIPSLTFLPTPTRSQIRLHSKSASSPFDLSC